MALITGQFTAGTTSVILFTQPAGPAVVTVTSGTASTATAWIGAGSAVTSSNGYPLAPGAAVSWAAYAGSRMSPVSAITTASSAATLAWIISSPQ
jgi:hypothetical protein